MLRTLLAGALLTALATAALAQPITQTPGAGPPDLPLPPRERARLFISSMGEPFRMADGLGAWLAGADADHDGAVTLDEFRADAQRFFRQLDADHDGKIDGFEIQAYETDIAPEITHLGQNVGGGGRRGFFGGGRGGRGGGDGAGAQAEPGGSIRAAGAEGAARFSLLNIAEPVASADEDLNGRVSAEEWEHAVTRRFEKLDHGKTGRLTAESLRNPAPKKK
jgi:hypothetical protein